LGIAGDVGRLVFPLVLPQGVQELAGGLEVRFLNDG
jgi:hypothetical protein